MIERLKNIILNLLRVIKHLLASIFIRRATPGEVFPGISKLVHRFDSRVETPELPAMNIYPPGRTLQNSYYRFPFCYGMKMPSVLYDPHQGLVLDKNRIAIEDKSQVPMRKHWYRWKPFLSNNIEEISGVSFAFRSSSKLYYHLLTDHLPALFMLGKLDWGLEDNTKLLIPGPMTDVQKFFIPKLCPEQVEICEIKSERLYRLDQYLYVSYLSQRSVGCLPPYYLDHFLQLFAPSRPRQKNKRIYISRAKSKRRRILNEKELVAGLAKYGFVSYVLEEMSVEQQISLFYDAEMVVAPHGAGLVNLLFSDKTKLLELFPGPLLRPHYYFICKSLNHNYHYLCAREKNRFPFLADFDEEFNGSIEDFSVNCDDVFRAIEKMDK